MPRQAVYLGLGSNLGDRRAALVGGVRLLTARGVRALRMSPVYETEPLGGPPQSCFLNAVACGETDLGPEDLLDACLDAERAQGRVRGVRNGPRTLDIDILLYGGLVRQTARLTLPHPRMHERRFVLLPLAELNPQVRHPLLGLSAAEMLRRCEDVSRVVLWETETVRS